MSQRSVRRDAGTARKGMPLDDVTADEVQSLERVSSERTWRFRFAPRVEREYQQSVRYVNRHTRLALAVSTALMFFSVPFWGELLLGDAAAGTLGPIASLIGAVAALFAMTALLQFRFWNSRIVEWLLLVAFIGEAVFIEYLRYESERVGLWIDPSTSLIVPITVILLGRFRIDRAVFLVVGTAAALYACALIWPIRIAVRDESTWLIQCIAITGVLVSSITSKIDSRRQWASTLLLQMMAYRDSLTGLPNRRALENHFDISVRAVQRYGGNKILLALVDLDHFKNINDRYGHDYGDGVLAEFAMTLQGHARRALDIASRVGGEEFCLLVPDFDPRGAEAFLGRIVSGTMALEIPNEGTADGVLTCSIGAAIGDAGAELALLYKCADECLYDAKASGRNTFRYRALGASGG